MSAIPEPDPRHLLHVLGGTLPEPPAAAGEYRPVVVRDGFGFVSGQFPLRDGRLLHAGRVGLELDIEQGRRAARLAAVNVLAQIHRYLGGFDDFDGLLRVDGYVASAPDFVAQPSVLDAASNLFATALGAELGAHARSAVAVARLPLDSPIELVVTFRCRSRGAGPV